MSGSEVWQDCQSFPTDILHQWIEPHNGQKNDYAPHSTLSTPLFSPLSIHPHVWMVFREFPSTRFFFGWSHTARSGGSSSDVIHISIEWYLACLPSEFRRSDVNFSHAQVGSPYLLPHCGLCKSFSIASFPRTDCCFSHVVICVTDTFWHCCNSLGSCFGHDRANNDSRFIFPI